MGLAARRRIHLTVGEGVAHAARLLRCLCGSVSYGRSPGARAHPGLTLADALVCTREPVPSLPFRGGPFQGGIVAPVTQATRGRTAGRGYAAAARAYPFGGGGFPRHSRG